MWMQRNEMDIRIETFKSQAVFIVWQIKNVKRVELKMKFEKNKTVDWRWTRAAAIANEIFSFFFIGYLKSWWRLTDFRCIYYTKLDDFDSCDATLSQSHSVNKCNKIKLFILFFFVLRESAFLNASSAVALKKKKTIKK